MRYVSIVPGNSLGVYLLGDVDVDPNTDWHIACSGDEVEELIELEAAHKKYLRMTAKLKLREQEPLT
jgi:hypothetical protein